MSYAGQVSENPVSAARERIASHTKQIEAYVESLLHICDVVFGADVPATCGAPIPPVRNGEFGLLHESLDLQGQALERLLLQVGRLSTLGIVQPPAANQLGSASGSGKRY